jgi:hypothetical protein
MMGQELGVLVRSPERLDPLPDADVLFRSETARNPRVRCVTDESVGERVLGLTRDGGVL